MLLAEIQRRGTELSRKILDLDLISWDCLVAGLPPLLVCNRNRRIWFIFLKRRLFLFVFFFFLFFSKIVLKIVLKQFPAPFLGQFNLIFCSNQNISSSCSLISKFFCYNIFRISFNLCFFTYNQFVIFESE